jgi:GNAT superfamily N-acetyltransferase
VSDLVIREVSLAETRPLRRAILRPHQAVQEMAADEAPGAFAVGGLRDGELIAVGLIAPDAAPGAWRVRGMATALQARGSGAGRAVLDALIAHARANGATRIWCNARSPARGFYERAGFQAVSAEFELPQIGPHYRMELPEQRYPGQPQMEP